MIQTALIFICIILGISIALVLFLSFQVIKLRKRLDTFLRRGEEDLGSVLKNLIKESEVQARNIGEIFEKISRLERISEISFQKVGMVRYNPFKEVGGDQSFSIALLNAKNSGFVITSLYMREGTRVFAKPILAGKSEYTLSDEEKCAIQEALKI